jgi:hypothetical protein
LTQLVGRLEEEPRGLAGESLNKEVASRVWRNTQAYGAAVKQLATASVPQSQGKFVQLFAEENLRKSQHAREYPGLFANWDQISALLTKLINTRCPFSCYFKNIRAFKQIITSVLDGAQSMTTSARMEWWKNAGLPRRFRILSLNATMPGPVEDGALSPIMALPHFGYTSPDFIFVQRPSYYVMLENGAGILNDSAVSYTRSRYWPELDPTNGRSYDQLGLLASHHFGIGFHAAITNCFRTPNSFPRAQLIAALGSYLRRYPQPP